MMLQRLPATSHSRPALARTVSLRSSFDLSELAAEEWMQYGVCAETDPDVFFPEQGESAKPGKRICEGCPVIGECLEFAMNHGERFGIWGGLTDRERRQLRWADRGGKGPHAFRPNGHGTACRCSDCDQYRKRSA